jgi:hypothetical protein
MTRMALGWTARTSALASVCPAAKPRKAKDYSDGAGKPELRRAGRTRTPKQAIMGTSDELLLGS